MHTHACHYYKLHTKSKHKTTSKSEDEENFTLRIVITFHFKNCADNGLKMKSICRCVCAWSWSLIVPVNSFHTIWNQQLLKRFFYESVVSFDVVFDVALVFAVLIKHRMKPTPYELWLRSSLVYLSAQMNTSLRVYFMQLYYFHRNCASSCCND